MVVKRASMHAIALILVVLIYIPFAMVLLDSVKNNLQYTTNPFGLTLPLHLGNYGVAWRGVDSYLLNTFIVAACTIVVSLTFSSLASYAFARFRFPLRGPLFVMFLGLLMIPGVLTIIPMFFEVRKLHVTGTLLALILPYIAISQPMGIFILRSFFESLPEELFEAGRMDGAGELYLFRRIAIPLSTPIIGANAILITMSVWADYLWPVVISHGTGQFTISAGIAYFGATFGAVQPLGPMFAAYVLASLPVVLIVILAMRTYVAGMTAGAIKL